MKLKLEVRGAVKLDAWIRSAFWFRRRNPRDQLGPVSSPIIWSKVLAQDG